MPFSFSIWSRRIEGAELALEKAEAAAEAEGADVDGPGVGGMGGVNSVEGLT